MIMNSYWQHNENKSCTYNNWAIVVSIGYGENGHHSGFKEL